MKLKLISINEILDKSFLVPSYQRGYRWDERQVLDLLQDINDFQKKRRKAEGEFYCLQPIVITRRDNDIYEIIDGQQRLTTLYLILTYLKDAREILFNTSQIFALSYETREKSKEFLENIASINKIDRGNIDFYYISKAYFTIKGWFEENKINKGEFLNTLLKTEYSGEKDLANNVRFIWYEVDTVNRGEAKDLFTRINMGKIPLSNAELIKALFLVKSNFNDNVIEQEKYKFKISYEWDNIEKTLQNDNFWFFFNNKSDIPSFSRIEFIFNLIADKYKNEVSIKVNKSIDNYYTFYIFDELIKSQKRNRDELWEEVKFYLKIFEEWYSDNDYYHLIGYLIHVGKEVKEIIERYLTSKSKKEFKKKLKELIREYLNKEYKKEGINRIEELNYHENRKLIENILLLFNVITSMDSKYIRFPFDKYVKEKWSIEHIHAINTEKFKTKEKIREFLEEQEKFFKEINEEDFSKKVKVLLEYEEISEEDIKSFGRDLLIKYGDEDLLPEKEEIHSIKNLALLSIKVNSSLGNNIFPVKREKIIQLDKEGKFIPICTKNVFLKYYNKEAKENLKWTKDDRDKYLKVIKELLTEFLPDERKKNGK